MICISVAPESRQLAKVDLLNASRQCDLIELCLDNLHKEPDVEDLLEGIDKPILVSCRRPEDGGKWKGTEDERLKLLRNAIVAGPAFVELDFEAAKQIRPFGKTQRVVSYTSLDRPLGNVEEIIGQAMELKADVVKFTWPTSTLDAAWPLLAAVTKKRTVPVVGVGIGRGSATFSLLGRKYGSPWIYAALEKGMEAYPGQATVGELEELYSWSGITGGTKFVGIVGFGSSEQTTVKIFNAGFRRLNLKVNCLPLSIGRIDKLAQMLDVLKIDALIVSPQFGAHAVEFAPHKDDVAGQSGFADLVLHQPEGWTAYNMIWRHALQALEERLGRTSPEDRPLDRRNVLVIGANPLAQGVAYGIARRKGILSITDPDGDEAQKIAQMFSCRHVPFANLYDTLADVVILTDPAIEVGHKKTNMNPSYLRPSMTVLDLCRMPDDSDFVREARTRGARVVEPSQVYLNHVQAAFQSATGQSLPREALTEVLGSLAGT